MLKIAPLQVEVYAKSYCSCTLQLNLFLSLPTFLTHSLRYTQRGHATLHHVLISSDRPLKRAREC